MAVAMIRERLFPWAAGNVLLLLIGLVAVPAYADFSSFLTGAMEAQSEILDEKRNEAHQRRLLEMEYEHRAAMLEIQRQAERRQYEEYLQMKEREEAAAAIEATRAAEVERESQRLREKEQIFLQFKAGLISKKEARAALGELGLVLDDEVEVARRSKRNGGGEPSKNFLTPEAARARLEGILVQFRCDLIAGERNLVHVICDHNRRPLSYSGLRPAIKDRIEKEVFSASHPEAAMELRRKYFSPSKS